MTLETYTIEQLQSEIDRRNAVDDEARLLLADVFDAVNLQVSASRIRVGRGFDAGETQAIAVLAKKLTDVRAERADAQPTENMENPWIDWHGGDCPVGEYVPVDCKLRIGYVMNAIAASYLGWSHWGVGADIVAYRVLK